MQAINNDYWFSELNQIEERPDLRGLLKGEIKNKIIISEYKKITNHGAKLLTISENTYNNLKILRDNNQIELNAIVQFVWHKILSIYGKSEQTTLGNCWLKDGFTIDDVYPLILDHRKHNIIIDALIHTQTKMQELSSEINKKLPKIPKNILDSIIIYGGKQELTNSYKINLKAIESPLFIVVYEIDDKEMLVIELNYAKELFPNENVDDLLELFDQIIKEIGEQKIKEVSQITLLTNKQMEIIKMWREEEDRESVKIDKNLTLNKLFENVVSNSSDRTAIIYENTEITYKQLNEWSNQLANYLRKNCDLKPDEIIALVLDRSAFMIITILAVWKSGAAYVPIDPEYPDDRIKFILQDTKAKLLILNEKYENKLNFTEIKKLNVETIDSSLDQMGTENLESITSGSNLAYLIYTSGTTGRPKGNMIEHQTVIAFGESIVKRYFNINDYKNINNIESILLLTNYVFDVSIEQIILALLYGKTLAILRDTINIDDNFYYFMDKAKVSYISGTPSKMQMIQLSKLKYLKTLVLLGELLNERVFRNIKNNFSGKIINAYGVTEATIYNTAKVFNDDKYINSIGKGLANTKVLVLNNHLKMVPINAIGELYLTGECLGRGYLNRPELTSERFIPNPYQTEQERNEGRNARVYKTGDLVRMLSNGELEYIGRNDMQVKIRGLRIELGEIESVLSSYEKIKQSVVVAKEFNTNENKSQKYLIGYFVSDSQLDEPSLKEYMQTKLPDYMIPNRLIQIEKIPVTTSGKLDSRALPDPDFSKSPNLIKINPRNHIESFILETFSKILNISKENLSTDDDFFSLGGDSILCIKLSFLLTKNFSFNISLSDIFKHKTISKLSTFIEQSIKTSQTNNILIENVDSSSNEYQLSLAQERLLFLNEYDQNGTNAYNVFFIYSVSEKVNFDSLFSAIFSIIKRHEILRTLICVDKNGNQIQVLLNENEAKSLLKLTEIHAINQHELENGLLNLSKYVFNLRNELPFKAILFKLQDNDSFKHYIGLVFHHICFDGWSFNIFKRELEKFYDYFDSKSPSSEDELNLPRLHIQYKDFSHWQRNFLTGDKYESLLNFWKNKLEHFEMLNLTSDFPNRPVNFDYSGNELSFELEAETTLKLKQLAMNLKVSLFSVLLSAYAYLLSVYTNQYDIVVGTPVTNRNYPETENLIGFFVNLMVLRVKINPNEAITEFIKNVSNEVIDATINEEMPFEKLVKELNIEKDTSRHPIVQVIFAMEIKNEEDDLANTKILSKNGLKISEYPTQEIKFTPAKFDLATSLTETKNKISGTMNYATKIFRPDKVKQLIKSYKLILTSLANQLNCTNSKRLIEIDCVDENEKHFLNTIYNEFDVALNVEERGKTIHSIFEEEIVPLNQDKIAVVNGILSLTYNELNKKANMLAHYLRSISDIKPDDIIALLLDKSELMIMSILGVWKSGAAYVPIDPNYPEDRIRFMLEDTKSKVLISHKKYSSKLNITNYVTVDVDSIFSSQVQEENILNLEPISSNHNLAYVIYTSGTTGRPKGVLIEHRNIISYRNSLIRGYFENHDEMESHESYYFSSNYVFDFSIEQFILSILNGKKLIIFESFECDENFYEFMNKNNLTHLSTTPSQIKQFDICKLINLKTIVLGGESISRNLLENLTLDFKGKIFNAYGVTEASVCNLLYKITRNELFSNRLGTSLSNTKVLVLNNHLKMVPINAIGELYLTGECLGRGYLNRPELTSERFIPNPYQTEQERNEGRNARVYKTGDLVRMLSNGELEYIGRNDMQVKIRGLRIELGEIESVLSSYEKIKQSVVVAKEFNTNENKSQKYLIGYFVSDSQLDEPSLKEYMQTKLPDYMIPNRLIQIEKIPVTTSGKLDARALPDPDFTPDKIFFSAPRNEIEQKICQIWSDSLGVESIGIEDDFFTLGGDSVLLIKIISKINLIQIGIKISPKDIFVNKTIKCLFDNVIYPSLQNELSTSKPKYTAQEHDSKQIQNFATDFEEPFVTFNDNAEKILFVLPPGEGGAESYFNNIVVHLSTQFKLVLFNNFYLHLKNKDFENIVTFEMLASFYINYVKNIQKKGPYNFFGWSMGGVVSFEMCRQLVNLGEKVDNLFIVDSFFNDKKALSETHLEDNIDVTERINFLYSPSFSFDELFIKSLDRTNILFFKATCLVDNYKNNNQLRFLKHYMDTECNYFDTLIDKKFIKIIEMKDCDHHSWITNKQQVENVCNQIKKYLFN